MPTKGDKMSYAQKKKVAASVSAYHKDACREYRKKYERLKSTIDTRKKERTRYTPGGGKIVKQEGTFKRIAKIKDKQKTLRAIVKEDPKLKRAMKERYDKLRKKYDKWYQASRKAKGKTSKLADQYRELKGRKDTYGKSAEAKARLKKLKKEFNKAFKSIPSGSEAKYNMSRVKRHMTTREGEAIEKKYNKGIPKRKRLTYFKDLDAPEKSWQRYTWRDDTYR